MYIVYGLYLAVGGFGSPARQDNLGFWNLGISQELGIRAHPNIKCNKPINFISYLGFSMDGNVRLLGATRTANQVPGKVVCQGFPTAAAQLLICGGETERAQ